MEEFKFERKHLTTEEKLGATVALIVAKLGIPQEELNEMFDDIVKLKNEQLKKQPGSQAFMNLFGGMMNK